MLWKQHGEHELEHGLWKQHGEHELVHVSRQNGGQAHHILVLEHDGQLAQALHILLQVHGGEWGMSQGKTYVQGLVKVMGIQSVQQTQLFHLQDENEHELGLAMVHTLGCQLESRQGHHDPQLVMQVLHVLGLDEDLPHELVDCQRWMELVNDEPQLVWVNDEPQGQENVQMELVMKQNVELLLVHELVHGLVHELVHGLVHGLFQRPLVL